MGWWKVLGVAAFVGVAATGIVVARSERRQEDYPPDQIRARLHARAAEALGSDAPVGLDAEAAPGS
jgi:hypothetical protein